jgi:Tol biopolymer transport system component
MLIIISIIAACSHIRVESEPSNANVQINGRQYGKTPTRPIRLLWIKDYPVVVSKEGYDTFYGNISTDENPYRVKLVEKEIPQAGNLSVSLTNEDGRIIAIKEVVHAETDTIERSPNVKAVRKITNLPGYSWLGKFQPSPDGKSIIFEQYEEENPDSSSYSNLWLTSISGGPVRRITQGQYLDNSPSFSSDGKIIYFSSNRLESFDLWKLSSLNGAGLGLITNSTMMQEDYPSTSKDGSIILFSSIVSGSEIKQIWTLGTKNNELFQLREGKWPQWFNIDTSIIYSSLQRTTGEWKIWTMNRDGSFPVQISTTNGSNDIHASVSPDGKKIVFASDRGISAGKRNYDIWLCDIDGSNLLQLTTNGSHDDYPVFSPDGNTIYFRSNRGVKWDIWAMKLAN